MKIDKYNELSQKDKPETIINNLLIKYGYKHLRVTESGEQNQDDRYFNLISHNRYKFSFLYLKHGNFYDIPKITALTLCHYHFNSNDKEGFNRIEYEERQGRINVELDSMGFPQIIIEDFPIYDPLDNIKVWYKINNAFYKRYIKPYDEKEGKFLSNFDILVLALRTFIYEDMEMSKALDNIKIKQKGKEKMNIIEAFEAMRNGKKVRKKEWHKSTYIYMCDDETIKRISKDFNYPEHIIEMPDINMRDEWELYDEEMADILTVAENNAKRIKELTEIIRRASDELNDILGG